jgi:hypothetical protein
MYAPPTRREFALVVLLFVSLLFFFSGNFSRKGYSRVDLSTVWHDVSSLPKSSGIPSLPSSSRLSWGSSQVPRTRIIVHAPGVSTPV